MLMSWTGYTPREVGRVTMREFSYYAEAERLKMEKTNRNIALQAWLNQSAQATNKKGNKSAYKHFQDFYDKNFGGKKKTEKVVSIAERNYRLNQLRKGGK